MKNDGFGPRAGKSEPLNVDGIRKDIKRCRDLEDAEPCYHCRQKQFLLDQLDSLLKTPELRGATKSGD